MISRTYKWAHAPADGVDEDVYSFNQTEPFLVEGEPPSAPFVLSAKSWQKLGEPHRIKVTVSAAEESMLALAKETHPGFTVVCDKCGSKNVIVDSSVGSSETSGVWGSVDLECQDCQASTEIWHPY